MDRSDQYVHSIPRLLAVYVYIW